MKNVLLTIAMLATLLLAAGGLWLVAKQHDVKRGALMLVAAAVILGNVWIWSLPVPGQ